VRKVRAGRPPKPEGEAKASTFSVRLTTEERARIDAAAERAGLTPSEWARQVLLANAQED